MFVVIITCVIIFDVVCIFWMRSQHNNFVKVVLEIQCAKQLTRQFSKIANFAITFGVSAQQAAASFKHLGEKFNDLKSFSSALSKELGKEVPED